jgi:hypothetical protein
MKKNIVWAVFSMLLAVGLVACSTNKGGVDEDTGGDSNPPASEETYEVTEPNTWTVSSSLDYSGSILFSHIDEGLSWVDLNSGSTNLAMLFWSRILLQYPITEGDTWSESGGSNGFTVDTTTVIEDTDAQVEVPAGTFTSCVVTSEIFSVDPEYNNGVYIAEYRRYFAPAVGLVKLEARWKDGNITVGELLEYEVHDPDPNDYFPLTVSDWWKFDWSTN